MNSCRKGKAGERAAARALNTVLGTKARRGQQRSGVDVADVIDGIPGTHCEVKWYARIAAINFLRQAERDAPDGDIPYALVRENGDTGWAVLVRLDRLPDIAERVIQSKG